MERVEYKGYVIEANPDELADGGRWTTNITIERHDGEGVMADPFSAANTFDTKEEATAHCINFGRQIIDGQVSGCQAP